MDNQQQDTTRAAAYLAAKERLDLRGPKSTRTGKTRNSVNCTAGNKRCGNRCIPNNWDCRLEGKGTNSELASHKTDPLAGIASLQRGSKDLFQGVVRVNPAQVQRGRNSLIRGTVKLAPGNNLEQKKQLKKQLTEASTPIMAVLGVTLVGLAGHAGLKRGFASYRNGVGAQIDRAASNAVDSILDRMPGTAGKRAATRAAGATALGQIGGAVTRGQRLEQTRVATSGNTGRIGPLSFRPNAANEDASFLSGKMTELRQRAKAGQLSYDEYRSNAVETLYGATNQGSRLNGQKGSIFSEHAANEFLVSKYKLNGVGAVGANASESIANRNRLVDTQIAERLGTWGETMRSDMKLRRMTGPQGEIRARDIDQYIRTVGGGSLDQSFAGMNAAQRNQASGEARQLMRSVLGGNDLKKEAKSMRLALVSQFDTYFDNTAQMMRRNAAASDSPFGDGLTGLARYVRRTTNNPGPILSRDHADLIVRNDYHERVMKLRSDYTIGENTARRVAQQITRSPDLPDADAAFRVLNNNGFPRLSRTGSTTGKAAPELRNLSQVARDILARPGNEKMTPAAAEREARRIITERGDSTDSGLPPRVEVYLAARRDFREGQRLGKSCGESHIPKTHECHKKGGTGQQVNEATEAQNKDRKKKLATIAAVAGGALAIGLAGSVAYNIKTISDPTKSPLAPSPKVKDLVKTMKKEAGTKSASEAMGHYYTKKSGLKPGDVVYFRNDNDPAAHFGIYLGEGKDGIVRAVIANTKESRFSWSDVSEIGATRPGIKTPQALMTPLVKAPAPKFAKGSSAFSNEEVVRRAIRISNTDYKFSLTRDNCEALANGIAYGVPESEQLQRFRRATRAVVDIGVSRGQRREAREAIYKGRAQGRSYTAREFVTFLEGKREFSSPSGKDLARQYAQYFQDSRLDAEGSLMLGLISPEKLWSQVKSYGPAIRAKAMGDYLLIQRSLVEMQRGAD